MISYKDRLFLSRTLESGNVFAQDVKFDVDGGAYLDVLEIGVFHGIGDDGDLEGIVRGIAYGERNAVDRHATLVDGKVASSGHLLVVFIFKGEILAAVRVLDVGTLGSLVDVSLYDMSVEPSVHDHRTFDVYLVANPEHAQIASVECLFHGGHGVDAVLDLDYCETHAIVGDALVNLQFVAEGAFHGEVNVLPVPLDVDDGGVFFNDS